VKRQLPVPIARFMIKNFLHGVAMWQAILL